MSFCFFNYFYCDVELFNVLTCLLLLYLRAMTLFVLTSNKKHKGIFPTFEITVILF